MSSFLCSLNFLSLTSVAIWHFAFLLKYLAKSFKKGTLAFHHLKCKLFEETKKIVDDDPKISQ